jgi:hypothetical protein
MDSTADRPDEQSSRERPGQSEPSGAIPWLGENGSAVLVCVDLGLANAMRKVALPVVCSIHESRQLKAAVDRRRAIVVCLGKESRTQAEITASQIQKDDHPEAVGVLDLVSDMGFSSDPAAFISGWEDSQGMGHYTDGPDFLREAERRAKWRSLPQHAADWNGLQGIGDQLGDWADDAADSDEHEPPIAIPEWPRPPDPDAYHGLAGDVVRMIEPETEADPIAVLVQFLVVFGNLIGRTAHAAVGQCRHYLNEFTSLVGDTSIARKGTAWHINHTLVSDIDEDWRSTRIQGGLSSGEGLISFCRDPLEKKEPIKEKGRVVGYQDVIEDHGISDKRALVIETEFGGVLKILAREGNKLSAVMRQAWDGDVLAIMTKSFPFRATGAHISIIAHITSLELTTRLTECDQANEFSNRFLWVCCRRSKLLPFGGNMAREDIDPLRARLRTAVEVARGIEYVRWTRPAMDLWVAEYPRLTAPREGAFGTSVSRAEAHTLRLATIYALLDQSDAIELVHLQAALALWDYCERSAAYIFGSSTGDTDADQILAALRSAEGGLSRTQIRREVFMGHSTADRIAQALATLVRHGLARPATCATTGRPKEVWVAC